MLYQISSGAGPIECSMGVSALYHHLMDKYSIDLIYYNEDKRDKSYFKSCIIDSETPLDDYVGTVLWIYKSPVRDGRDRKNWYLKVSKLEEPTELDQIDESMVRFNTMRAGGPGGQHVNKVESGVEAIYEYGKTEIKVRSTEQRSQLLNKKNCIVKINTIISELNKSSKADSTNKAWQEHNTLVRGTPCKTFEGKDFKEVIK